MNSDFVTIKSATGTLNKTCEFLKDPNLLTSKMNKPGSGRKPGRPPKKKPRTRKQSQENNEQSKRILPSQPTTSKPTSSPTPGTSTPLLLNNSFDSLINDDDMNNDDLDSTAKSTTLKPYKIKPMPPIVVTSTVEDVFKFNSKIKQCAKEEVHFKCYPQTKHIITYNKTDYECVQKELIDNNYQFYSYSLKDDKPKKLCLKGIDKCYKSQDILEEIKKLTDEVNNVTQLKSLKNKNELLSVFLVYFKSSCILKTIPDKIRYLCDHKIKWEPYNKGRQNAITQCSRCQQFGHAESNCNNSFRCVKCLKMTMNHENVPKQRMINQCV